MNQEKMIKILFSLLLLVLCICMCGSIIDVVHVRQPSSLIDALHHCHVTLLLCMAFVLASQHVLQITIIFFVKRNYDYTLISAFLL